MRILLAALLILIAAVQVHATGDCDDGVDLSTATIYRAIPATVRVLRRLRGADILASGHGTRLEPAAQTNRGRREEHQRVISDDDRPGFIQTAGPTGLRFGTSVVRSCPILQAVLAAVTEDLRALTNPGGNINPQVTRARLLRSSCRVQSQIILRHRLSTQQPVMDIQRSGDVRRRGRELSRTSDL